MAQQSASSVALITGGTTGIGFATARLLHERGYSVLATGQNPDTIAAAKKKLPSDVIVSRSDSRSIADAIRLSEELRSRFGKVDFAYFNAGVSRMLPIEQVDEEFFDDHFGTNVKGQFFILQKILPLFVNGGSALFTTSVGAKRGIASYAVALATKGAITSIVPSLAVELAPRGIRVNAIRPGTVDTPAFDKLGLPADALAGFRQMIPQRVPAGRFGTAEEIAEVAAFLASPAASYVNGTTIDVDGGLLSAL
jgi:NAD(P)-dependent dehydrogenase (short-subunit alcohol dehydrogenase family)